MNPKPYSPEQALAWKRAVRYVLGNPGEFELSTALRSWLLDALLVYPEDVMPPATEEAVSFYGTAGSATVALLLYTISLHPFVEKPSNREAFWRYFDRLTIPQDFT